MKFTKQKTSMNRKREDSFEIHLRIKRINRIEFAMNTLNIQIPEIAEKLLFS